MTLTAAVFTSGNSSCCFLAIKWDHLRPTEFEVTSYPENATCSILPVSHAPLTVLKLVPCVNRGKKIAIVRFAATEHSAKPAVRDGVWHNVAVHTRVPVAPIGDNTSWLRPGEINGLQLRQRELSQSQEIKARPPFYVHNQVTQFS